jgi:hypothetical protein
MFVIVSGGSSAIVATMVYVTKLPAGNAVSVSLIASVPLPVQPAPAFAAHVHVCDAMPAGTGSSTVVPSAAAAPVLVTVIVYVTVPPGVSVVVSAVFVMLICGFEVTFAVAVHGPGVLPGVQTVAGSTGDTVTVLLTIAGGAASTIAVTVYVTKLPAGNVAIASLIAPAPDAVVQVAPPLGVHVQLWLATPAGIGSSTGVPSAATTPVFDTTIVYAIVPPGVTVVVSAVLLTPICGTGGRLAVAEHGAGVLVGEHAPFGGVAVAVLLMFVGGVVLTVALIV